MKYMGSKNRIAKFILPIMVAEAEKQGIDTWVEPFVGGANIIDKVPNSFKRIGYDLNPHTIAALVAIRDMVDQLPESVSEQDYKSYKGKDADPITSWVRFGCSFGGKFENGYARSLASNGLPRNHTGEARSNAQKQSQKLQGVELVNQSYDTIIFQELSLIYCDPPYQGTTGYKTGAFDHSKFFDWCRQKKKEGHTVFVSEYQAPDDFELIWQGEVKTTFASQRKSATHNAVEKLFKYKGGINERLLD
jgi:DNA adenine methylase